MKNNKAVFSSLFINVFFLILCFAFGKPLFGAVDDYFMARVLEGVYGNDYNVHLTFVNALYGYALLPFYYLFPKVGWYYIGEIFSVFISLSAIGYVIIKRAGLQLGSLLTLALVAAFASDYYLVVQFTQCAAVLSGAGFLCLVYAIGLLKEQRKERVFCLVLGLFLLLWGAVMRYEAFLMGSPFCLFVLLLQFKTVLGNKKTVIVCMLLLLGGICGIRALDKRAYDAPEYKKYMAFQGPRFVLTDGSNYNEQLVYEDLEELGYSGIDFQMLKTWNLYDNRVFSLDSLAPIFNVIKNHYNFFNFYSLPGALLSNLASAATRPSFWPWALMSIAIFYLNKKKFVYVFGSLIILLCLVTYLLYINRVVYRVETGFWLYATISIVPLLQNFSPALLRYKKVLYLVMLCVLAINVVLYYPSAELVRSPRNAEKRTLINAQDTSDYVAFLNYADSMPGNTVLLMPMNPFMELSHQKNPPYLSEEKGSWSKIIPMGYWLPYFPDIENIIHEKDVDNPLEDVVKENVYVVDDGVLKGFLQRHYYDSVSVETVRDFNGLKVYKYSIVDTEAEK